VIARCMKNSNTDLLPSSETTETGVNPGMRSSDKRVSEILNEAQCTSIRKT
jgi:hypothetical protein